MRKWLVIDSQFVFIPVLYNIKCVFPNGKWELKGRFIFGVEVDNLAILLDFLLAGEDTREQFNGVIFDF